MQRKYCRHTAFWATVYIFRLLKMSWTDSEYVYIYIASQFTRSIHVAYIINLTLFFSNPTHNHHHLMTAGSRHIIHKDTTEYLL